VGEGDFRVPPLEQLLSSFKFIRVASRASVTQVNLKTVAEVLEATVC